VVPGSGAGGAVNIMCGYCGNVAAGKRAARMRLDEGVEGGPEMGHLVGSERKGASAASLCFCIRSRLWGGYETGRAGVYLWQGCETS
jgi:hypothetical protein